MSTSERKSSVSALQNSIGTIALDVGDVKLVKAEPQKLGPCLICFQDSVKLLEIEFQTHQICQDCFTDYLKTEIVSAKVDEIRCPHCNIHLHDDLIVKLVPGDIWLKYMKFKANLAIVNDPLARWCPSPDCSNIIRLQKLEQSEASCDTCQTRICTKCNQAPHPTTTCEQLLAEEVQKWGLKKDIAKCPNCNMVVEKENGCNHMKCTICTYEFCWLCLSAYTVYHYKHWNPLGCPGRQSEKNLRRRGISIQDFAYRFGLVLLFLLSLPIALLFWFPMWFVKIMTRRWRLTSGCSRCWTSIFFFLVGVILNAIAIPLTILYIIPAAIYHLVKYTKIRYDLYLRSQARLKYKKDPPKATTTPPVTV